MWECVCVCVALFGQTHTNTKHTHSPNEKIINYPWIDGLTRRLGVTTWSPKKEIWYIRIFFSTNQDSSVFLGFCSTLRLRHARVRPVEGFSRAPFAFKDSVIEWFCNWYHLSHFAAFFNEIGSQVIHRDTLWKPCSKRTQFVRAFERQKMNIFVVFEYARSAHTKRRFFLCVLEKIIGKWSSCRFTYSYLVTTFTSSIEEISVNFQTNQRIVCPITCIAPSSETTTGGVYKWQGRNRHSLMSCAYETFLVARPIIAILGPKWVDVIQVFPHPFDSGRPDESEILFSLTL